MSLKQFYYWPNQDAGYCLTKSYKIFTFHSKVFDRNMFLFILQAVHFVCVRSLRTVDPIVLVFWGAVVSVPPLAVAAYLRGALHLPQWGQIPSIFLVRNNSDLLCDENYRC